VCTRHERENAADFLDGLRVLVRAVTRRDDALGRSAVQVRAPVRDDAVAGIWRVTFASIPDYGVIGDARCDRYCVDRFHKRTVGRERIHRVGETLLM
jgi:hypothetical protein